MVGSFRAAQSVLQLTMATSPLIVGLFPPNFRRALFDFRKNREDILVGLHALILTPADGWIFKVT